MNELIIKPTSQWTSEESEMWLNMSIKERLEYDEAQVEQELPKFVKEFNRLCEKYGEVGDMTRELFMKTEYVEDALMELTYYGGVHYAQYSLYGMGCIPATEVETWNE